MSKHTSIAVYEGLLIPEKIKNFGIEAKSEIKKENDALNLAEENNIKVYEITGLQGAIGALASIGCFDLGLEAAALP